MLTARLESLIWESKAEYKTWLIGTPSAELKLSDDECIIITDIDYFPFIDSGTPDLSPGTAYFKKANKQITFSSQNRRSTYLVRNYFWESLGLLPDKVHFDTYLPFTETINFFCGTIPNTNFPWVIANGLAPDGTEAKGSPLGYGQVNDAGLIAINSIQMGIPREIRPHKNTPAATPIGFNQSFEDFQVPYDNVTRLVNPDLSATENGNYQYPLITVGYVRINKNLQDTFI